MKEFSKIVDEFNKISFIRCKGISVGDCLYHLIRTKEDECKLSKEIFSFIKRIIIVVFFINTDLQRQGKADSLFLLESAYRNRLDIRNNFDKIVKLSQNYVCASPLDKKRFSLFQIRHLPLFFRWIRQLKNIDISLMNKLNLMSFLLDAFLVYSLVERYERKNRITIQRLLTFNDVQYIESFFTQKYNQENKNTITLQHGVFSSKINNWAFVGSHSNYLLANSQFTVIEGQKASYSGKIIIAGLYSFVSSQQESKTIKVPLQTIGLCLDGDVYFHDNQRMITMLEHFCDKYQKKLRIRFHPTDNQSLYNVSKNTNIMISDEKDIFDYFKKVDVIIIRNSTILLEAAQSSIPVYILYDNDQEGNIYSSISVGRFTTEEELHDIINNRSAEEIFEDVRRQQEALGLPENVTENYRKILQSLQFS